MANKDCGCNQPPSEDADYLMVKATASQANACGNPSTAATPLSTCPNQDPTFDSLLSDFVLPAHGLAVGVSVCNNTIYAVGQYLQFVDSNVIVSIAALDAGGKIMTIRNACNNGNEIGNPSGVIINSGAKFYAVQSPPCLSSEEQNTLVADALNSSTELCVPSLGETTDTSVVQIVGRRESDSEDSSAKKCIRRVKAFLFKLGAPFLPSITQATESDNAATYSRLGIRRTGGEKGQVVQLKEIPDYAFGTTADKLRAGFKYIFAGNSAQVQKPVGPAFVYSPFDPVKLFEEKGTISSSGTYTNLASGGTYTKSFSLNIPEITTNLKNKDLQDHYYLNLHLIVAVQAGSAGAARYMSFKINDVLVTSVWGNNAGMYSGHALTIPVKILNTDTSFELKIQATGAGQAFYYKVTGLGAYI